MLQFRSSSIQDSVPKPSSDLFDSLCPNCSEYLQASKLSISAEHLSRASQPSISAKHLSNAEKLSDHQQCSALPSDAQQCPAMLKESSKNYSITLTSSSYSVLSSSAPSTQRIRAVQRKDVRLSSFFLHNSVLNVHLDSKICWISLASTWNSTTVITLMYWMAPHFFRSLTWLDASFRGKLFYNINLIVHYVM